MSRETFTTTAPHETYAGYATLEVMCCPDCGVTYAVPQRLLEHARKDPDQWWHCPNGHSLHFPGKTEAQKLEEKERHLQAERDRRARLQAQLDQTQAQLRSQKGAATRARNERDRVRTRAKAGVCPCCNRTFKQLAAHMQKKHPGFDPKAA